MTSTKYSQQQYDSFKKVYERYHALSYAKMQKLADKKFNDTVHPRSDAQIGIDVFYDDKKLGNIRCMVALFVVETKPRWWKFWDTAVHNEDFIIKPNGSFVNE